MMKRAYAWVSNQKRQRLDDVDTEEGVDLPDDIADLCQNYMDDGGAVSLTDDDVSLQPTDHRGVLRRKKEKINRLKVQRQALRRDLTRSRQAGCELESDMARLLRQHHKELSRKRRAQREVHLRKEAVTARERACTRLEQTLVQEKIKQQVDKHSHEKDVVDGVVRRLVDSVELTAMTTDLQSTREDLMELKTQEQHLRAYTVSLEQERRATEDLVVVEKHLLRERVESFEVQLKTTQDRLRKEERAHTEVKTYCALLQEEVTSKSNWLTALSLGSMSLVNNQEQIATRVDAERAEWQLSMNHLQQERDGLQAEQTNQQKELLAENAELREMVRLAQLGEVDAQQQLKSAQQAAKKAKSHQKKLRTELKTLREEWKTLQEGFQVENRETAPLQHQVALSPAPAKANPERLLTLRSNNFFAKRARGSM